MKHNAKRFLSLLLALVMVIGLMPVSHAHAEEETYLKISEQVTSVGENATYVIALAGTRKALTTINLEVVDAIREGAFYGCSALENLTFAEGVVIEAFAFSKTPYAYLNPQF